MDHRLRLTECVVYGNVGSYLRLFHFSGKFDLCTVALRVGLVNILLFHLSLLNSSLVVVGKVNVTELEVLNREIAHPREGFVQVVLHLQPDSLLVEEEAIARETSRYVSENVDCDFLARGPVI